MTHQTQEGCASNGINIKHLRLLSFLVSDWFRITSEFHDLLVMEARHTRESEWLPLHTITEGGVQWLTWEGMSTALGVCLHVCQTFALKLHNVTQGKLNSVHVTLADAKGMTYEGYRGNLLAALVTAMEHAFMDGRTVSMLEQVAEHPRVKPADVGSKWVSAGQFQNEVRRWTVSTFGADVADDVLERGHRFTEEALELAQVLGVKKHEVHLLLNRVYGRPAGELKQEVGGVMVTLAAACAAMRVDMDSAGRTELAGNWQKQDKIKAKWLTKVQGSPLPDAEGHQPAPAASEGSTVLGVLDANPITLLDGVPVTVLEWRSPAYALPEEFWPAEGYPQVSEDGSLGILTYTSEGVKGQAKIKGVIHGPDQVAYFSSLRRYLVAVTPSLHMEL